MPESSNSKNGWRQSKWLIVAENARVSLLFSALTSGLYFYHSKVRNHPSMFFSFMQIRIALLQTLCFDTSRNCPRVGVLSISRQGSWRLPIVLYLYSHSSTSFTSLFAFVTVQVQPHQPISRRLPWRSPSDCSTSSSAPFAKPRSPFWQAIPPSNVTPACGSIPCATKFPACCPRKPPSRRSRIRFFKQSFSKQTLGHT